MEGSVSGSIQETGQSAIDHLQNMIDTALNATREEKDEAVSFLADILRKATDGAEKLAKSI